MDRLIGENIRNMKEFVRNNRQTPKDQLEQQVRFHLNRRIRLAQDSQGYNDPQERLTLVNSLLKDIFG
jgi:hypothetical protein